MAKRDASGPKEVVPQPTRSGGPSIPVTPLRPIPQAEAEAVRQKPRITVDGLRDMFIGWGVGTIFIMTWAPRNVNDGEVFITRCIIVKNNRVVYDGTGSYQLPHERGASIDVWAIVTEHNHHNHILGSARASRRRSHAAL